MGGGKWQEEWLEAWALAKKEGPSQSPNALQFPQPWACSLDVIFYLHGNLGQLPSFREILRKLKPQTNKGPRGVWWEPNLMAEHSIRHVVARLINWTPMFEW